MCSRSALLTYASRRSASNRATPSVIVSRILLVSLWASASSSRASRSSDCLCFRSVMSRQTQSVRPSGRGRNMISPWRPLASARSKRLPSGAKMRAIRSSIVSGLPSTIATSPAASLARRISSPRMPAGTGPTPRKSCAALLMCSIRRSASNRATPSVMPSHMAPISPFRAASCSRAALSSACSVVVSANGPGVPVVFRVSDMSHSLHPGAFPVRNATAGKCFVCYANPVGPRVSRPGRRATQRAKPSQRLAQSSGNLTGSS